MKKILLIGGILVFSLQASWKNLNIEERKAWVERHFGKYEVERLGQLKLLEDDWLFEGRQPDSMNVRIVGRWPWGGTYRVTGDTIRRLVFQGSGSGVRILDISNMPNIQELSTIVAPYAGSVYGLAVKDTILVILQGADGFMVYGVTDLTNPNELSRTFIGQWLNDCFIRDSLLFIGGDDSLRIYNLKVPTSPIFLGGCPLPDEGHGIYVLGNYAYLTCWTSGMYIYNISDPGNPQQVGFWPIPSPATVSNEIWVYSNHAYVATDSGLYIVNVSNVSNPWEVSNYPYGNYVGIFMLSAPLKFVYLADIDVMRILDVSDSSNPLLVDSVQTPGAAFDVWANKEAGVGAYIFVGDDFEGIGVYDTEQPSNVQWLYQYGQADLAYDVVVQGNYLYVADDKAGVKIIDISNPQSPQEIASFGDLDYWWGYSAIGIKDTILFTTSGDRYFRSVSISDPSLPYLIDSIRTSRQGLGSVAISDTLAFIAESRLQGVDISDPLNLDTLKSFGFTSTSYDLYSRDSLVFCAVLYDGLRIVSYGDPYNPVEIGSFPVIDAAFGIWVVDTFAYLGADDDGLIILSIADPTSPYELGRTSFNCRYVRVVDSLAYMTGEPYYFKVLNISDPTNIQESGWYSFRGGQLWTDSNYIYCTRWGRGVVIYEFSGTEVQEQIESTIYKPIIPTIIRSSTHLKFSPQSNIEIRDTAGRLIKIARQGEEVTFNKISTGVYFLIEKQNTTTKIHKVVVIK